ncbi:MAG: HAD family hydrolase [Faecalibacterium sp.]
MPQPKGVLFWDWNGTLLDDVDFSLQCLNQLLTEFGYPQRYSLAEYREIFGFPIEEYYIRAGFDFSRHPYPVLAARYMELYYAGEGGCRPYPDAAATLDALRHSGWQLVILSASRRDTLIEQVSLRGLKGYFHELLGLSDIYGVSKVQAGLDWLHAQSPAPENLVMVGDSTHDAEVAAALSARCVLYTGGHQSRQRLSAVCRTVIDHLSELPEILA